MESSSVLFLAWPYDDLPLLEEVRRRLEGWAEPLGEGESTGVLWSQLFRVEAGSAPLRVWVTRSDGLISTAALGRVRWSHPEEEQRALAAGWWIGVETQLDREDPLQGYHLQLRFCQALEPSAPAVFDTCSHTLRPGSELARLTSTTVPPRTSELFSIHAVVGEDGLCWLHSHGLMRAHIPDLELLAVPEDLAGAGGHLLRGVAELLVGQEPPPPGQVLRVGHGLAVACQPWRKVVEALEPELGGAEDRDGEEHSGPRLALVSAGSPDDNLQTPLETLRVLRDDGGVLFVSRRETERMARLARERWAIFGMLFARHQSVAEDSWRFLAKLGLRVDPPGAEDPEAGQEREHLWFEVLEIQPGKLRGRLLNAPLRIARVREGDEGWYELEQLTDWNILTPLGAFNPETADYLWDAARPRDDESGELEPAPGAPDEG